MSGSTIGGVVGGAIGFFVGGPAGAQWGWMIGSAVGAYVDPEKVHGPRLADAQTQTAMTGVYITRGWGVFVTKGNLIWQEPTVVEHAEEQRSGKGGGPVTVEYTYTRSHAIGICRGPVAGILICKENGKTVLDQRTDAEILAEYAAAGMSPSEASARLVQQRAANGKFLENTTFYLGTDTQLPDPTMEEHLGVNNVPAYRGTVYMVREDPLLVLQGAISQYEFVVVQDGTASESGGGGLVAGRLSDFNNADFPLPEPEANYLYTGYLGNKGLGGAGGAVEIYSADSIAEIIQYFTDFDYSPYGGGTRAPNVFLGYSAATWTSTVPGIGLDIDLYGVSNAAAQPSVTDNEALVLVYNDLEPTGTHGSVGFTGFCSIDTSAVEQDRRGATGKLYPSNPGGQSNLFENCAGNDLYGFYPLCIRVTRKRLGPLSLADDDSYTPIPDAPGYFLSATGEMVYDQGFTQVSGDYRVLSEPATHTVDLRSLYTWYENGPALLATSPDNTAAFWTDAYNAAVAAGDLPAGWTYSTSEGPNSYPAHVASVWQAQDIPETEVDPDAVVLGTIVADLCRDEGLDTTEYDVSDLTDLVPGFRIASEGGADVAIAALQTVYLFDVGEWDGRVRFIKRGGTAAFSLNGDDLVEREGDPFEIQAIQEYELLRSVTVGYADPAAGYGPNTQKWERRTSIIEARGDASFELPITIDADTASTAAKRKGIAAWGEPEKHKFSLPMRLSHITPTDVGNYTDDAGEVRTLRVMLAEDDVGISHMETSTNSAEAYDAVAVGVTPKPPTIPDATIRGPTVLHAMNLDSLRAQDNVPGMYIAVRGLLPGWQGCEVQLSRDGGVTYQPLLQITTQARMGYLTADLDIPVYDSNGETIDSSGNPVTEPLSVFMYSGGTVSSVTQAQIDAGLNAWAITTDDVSELGQARTATSLGGGNFNLSNLSRGLRDTVPAEHASGAPFVMLDTAVQFVPIDASLGGEILYFRAVTFGTSADAAIVKSFLYEPATFVIDGGGA